MTSGFWKRAIGVVSVLAVFTSAVADDQPADLVLRGGKIVTMDDDCPTARALAARNGRIVLVGDDADVAHLIGEETRVIELQGRLAIPGFIDGHGHFIGLGRSKMILDLTKANSWDEIVDLVRKEVGDKPKGTWIVGRGWHQSKWRRPPQPHIQGYPVHDRLSQAVPDHPVWLTHASGHMSVANAAAMRLAAVDGSTSDPAGGEILHTADGEPTGVFRETAQGLIGRYCDDKTSRPGEIKRAIQLATTECLSKGVTSFQDAGSSFETIDLYRQLAESGQLKVRLWVMVSESNSRLARLLPRYRTIGAAGNRLTVRAIKRFLDGALGAHGAWLLEPYDDLPSSTGLNTISIASLRRTAEIALENDCQLCVHAIGDRANREVLDVFQAALREQPSPRTQRWRVEHAQHLHPDDIPRFAQLGVIASMQGVHCTSDAAFVVQRLGQQRAAQGAYAWQSLLQSGARVSNGTDTPVEDVDPIACFYASVTRKPATGEAFFPEQRMTRRQALRSYTLDAAYAAFEEDLKGSLTPGKLADVVVHSKDILTCPAEEIRTAAVVYTIVDGRVLYEQSACDESD